MSAPIPLLLISDAPTSGTGLGRITHDLAVRIAEHLPDVFRVATCGYGGLPSRLLPFPQYPWLSNSEWVIHELPEIWKDFAGNEKGVVMSIWDASRMLWFSRPENCPDDRLKRFLNSHPFQKWGYFPMDATGPHNRLTSILGHIIGGYDRVLAYSKWAEDILRRTLTPEECLDNELTNLPHGIDTSAFKPQHRATARHGFGERIGARTKKGKWLAIPDDALMIGIVGTNQARKDYGLAISTIAELARERTVSVWIHLDILERHWSLPALLNDFSLWDKTVITSIPLTDEQMSWCYSACDVTLGIGTGEGFGYPIFESLACGTPCIHGNDGGAAEHLPGEMLVDPVATRLEGPYCCQRSVYNPVDWVNQVWALPKKTGDSLLPAHLDWNNNWPRWEEWFRKGMGIIWDLSI